jgi:hypothetical protein
VWLYLGSYAWDNNEYARVEFALADDKLVGVRFNSTDKTWDLYVDGVKVASGAVSLASQALHNLRIYGTIADAGSMTVKIDGLTAISYNGDTKPGVSDQVEYVRFYAPDPGLSKSANMYLSSLSLNDGAADPGDRRAQVLMVNGDDSVQWTPSAGADNYAVLDQVPPSDDDFVETATNGHKDLLTLEDFGVTDITSIAGVTKFARAAKTTAGTQTLRNGVKSGATEDYTEHDLATDVLYYMHAMENNPDDSSPWADADLDALLALHEAVIP